MAVIFKDNLARYRRFSSLLDILFLLVAAGYIILINSLVGVLLFAFAHGKSIVWHAYSAQLIAVLLVIILGGMLVAKYKLLGGGQALARQIGARPIELLQMVPEERQLLQLTEEVAAAVNLKRVPKLYVLDDELGANAFLLGYRTRDTALVMTWGMLQLLDAQELKGVIAHQISRWLNADVRFNFRILILFSGLLSIAQLGTLIGRLGFKASARQPLQHKDRRAGVLFVIAGSVVWLLGCPGVMAARLLKYIFLRRRTYIADQRSLAINQDQSLLQALLRLRAYEPGSALHGVYVESVNHCCFASAMAKQSLLVTQPTLDERIYVVSPEALRRARVQERILLKQHMHVDLAAIEAEESDESSLLLDKPSHTPQNWLPPQPFPFLRVQPAAVYAPDSVRPLTLAVRDVIPRPEMLTRALSTATGCREILVAVMALRQQVACSMEQQHLSRAILESLSGLDQRLYVSIFLQAVQQMGHMPVSAAKNLLTRLALIMQADGHAGLLDVLLLERVQSQLNLLPQAIPVTMDNCINALVTLVEALLYVTDLPEQKAIQTRLKILRAILSPEQLLDIDQTLIHAMPVNMGQVLYQLSGLLQRDKMHVLAVIETHLWDEHLMTQEEQDVLDLLYWRLGLDIQPQHMHGRSKMALEI